jgi:hypothetical protein
VNFVAATLELVGHPRGPAYLDALASIIVMVLSLCMLAITVQQPEKLMVFFETTGREFVFSWRMRSIADVTQILFLVAFGFLGQIMAIVTGAFFFLAFSLAQKRPDIFRALFRKYAGDPMEAYEGEGDGGADMSYGEATEPSVARV